MPASGPAPGGSSPPPAATPSPHWRPRSTTPSRAGTGRTCTASLSPTEPRSAWPDWEGDDDWGEEPPLTDGRRLTLGRLRGGEQFLYTFDLGDDWTHLCTVAPTRIDPLDQVGIVPDMPLPYWGWGAIPDQYGREFDGDDGDTDLAPDPELTDLPPLRPHWGSRDRHRR
jgi:hypothetical protein